MKTPNSTSILDEHKKPNEIQQSSSKLSRRKFIMYGGGIAGSVALVGSKGIRASQHEIAIENLKKTPPGTVQSSTISNSTSNSIPPLSGRITAAPGIVSLTPGQEENAVLEYPFNDGFLFGVLVSNLHEFNTKQLFSGQLNKDIILTNLGPQAVFISAGDESNNTNFSDTPLKRPSPPYKVLISGQAPLSRLRMHRQLGWYHSSRYDMSRTQIQRGRFGQNIPSHQIWKPCLYGYQNRLI